MLAAVGCGALALAGLRRLLDGEAHAALALALTPNAYAFAFNRAGFRRHLERADAGLHPLADELTLALAHVRGAGSPPPGPS